ncbi:hypothetical protein AB0P17_36535 [Streptomyces sp. NPDC088124]|uniref:hypothetical protein n=1 Tax=Streptomyces sp. NPDC088124 TaxID=3154654 RepID=UPI0034348007
MTGELERALRRDNLLNPAEAAVWAETADALARTRRRRAPARGAALTLLRASVEAHRPRLVAAGWTADVAVGAGRARLEGGRPGGAAVMLTATPRRDGVILRRYVLHADGADWFVVGARGFEYFVDHRYLPGGAARQTYVPACRCGLVQFAEEQRAAARLLEIKIRRARQRTGSPRRPYRCPDDDRVWHLSKPRKNR